MKKNILLLAAICVMLLLNSPQEILSQVREHYAINSKLVTFNSSTGRADQPVSNNLIGGG